MQCLASWARAYPATQLTVRNQRASASRLDAANQHAIDGLGKRRHSKHCRDPRVEKQACVACGAAHASASEPGAEGHDMVGITPRHLTLVR